MTLEEGQEGCLDLRQACLTRLFCSSQMPKHLSRLVSDLGLHSTPAARLYIYDSVGCLPSPDKYPLKPPSSFPRPFLPSSPRLVLGPRRRGQDAGGQQPAQAAAPVVCGGGLKQDLGGARAEGCWEAAWKALVIFQEMHWRLRDGCEKPLDVGPHGSRLG